MKESFYVSWLQLSSFCPQFLALTCIFSVFQFSGTTESKVFEYSEVQLKGLCPAGMGNSESITETHPSKLTLSVAVFQDGNTSKKRSFSFLSWMLSKAGVSYSSSIMLKGFLYYIYAPLLSLTIKKKNQLHFQIVWLTPIIISIKTVRLALLS